MFGEVFLWFWVNVEYFGAVLSQRLVDSWKHKMDQEQVIGQAELYPLLVARLTWQDKIASNRVIYFLIFLTDTLFLLLQMTSFLLQAVVLPQ